MILSRALFGHTADRFATLDASSTLTENENKSSVF